MSVLKQCTICFGVHRKQLIVISHQMTTYTSKYDEYKNHYVEVGLTLKQIADDFGLNYKSLLQHSRRRGWSEDKEKHQEAIRKETEKLTQKRILQSAETLEQKNARRASCWKLIQHHVVTLLENQASFKPSELLAIANAFEKACKGERLEDGQPTELVKQETEVKRDEIFDAIRDQEEIIMDQESEIENLKAKLAKLQKTAKTG